MKKINASLMIAIGLTVSIFGAPQKKHITEARGRKLAADKEGAQRFVECPHCHKQILVVSITNHRKIHTKPFICEFPGCAARFSRRFMLTNHKKSHPTKQNKPRAIARTKRRSLPALGSSSKATTSAHQQKIDLRLPETTPILNAPSTLAPTDSLGIPRTQSADTIPVAPLFQATPSPDPLLSPSPPLSSPSAADDIEPLTPTGCTPPTFSNSPFAAYMPQSQPLFHEIPTTPILQGKL